MIYAGSDKSSSMCSLIPQDLCLSIWFGESDSNTSVVNDSSEHDPNRSMIPSERNEAKNRSCFIFKDFGVTKCEGIVARVVIESNNERNGR